MKKQTEEKLDEVVDKANETLESLLEIGLGWFVNTVQSIKEKRLQEQSDGE